MVAGLKFTGHRSTGEAEHEHETQINSVICTGHRQYPTQGHKAVRCRGVPQFTPCKQRRVHDLFLLHLLVVSPLSSS
jgi:hypothetical protein